MNRGRRPVARGRDGSEAPEGPRVGPGNPAAEPAAPEDDPTIALVRAGYDRIADRYAAWAPTVRDPARERFTDALLDRLPPRANVLDLGCGNGLPTAALLAAHGHLVTAIDVSGEQVARCRVNVPAATAIRAEMTGLDLPPAAFDAVVSFYAITHVPRARHAALFRSIAGWLAPGGLFAACLGAGAADGIDPDWLGVPMAFSHFDAAANLALLRDAGFAVLRHAVAETQEDGGAFPFLWVLAAPTRD
jgi:SAM-dependent methyltransferase